MSLTQTGAEASAIKTINMSSKFGEVENKLNTIRYIGRWKEGRRQLFNTVS